MTRQLVYNRIGTYTIIIMGKLLFDFFLNCVKNFSIIYIYIYIYVYLYPGVTLYKPTYVTYVL